MVTILQKDAPMLREKARKVPLREIGSEKTQEVLRNMKEAMHSEKDAVAIAAPQIGVSLRVFVVSGKVFTDDTAVPRESANHLTDQVFINPEIIKLSRKKVAMDEGCLSARWWYGSVNRAEKATIKAFDENGKAFTRGASGLLAQIFQHETDHLDGVLFIDKATKLREEPPKEKEA